jgi:hypothetical protein
MNQALLKSSLKPAFWLAQCLGALDDDDLGASRVG